MILFTCFNNTMAHVVSHSFVPSYLFSLTMHTLHDTTELVLTSHFWTCRPFWLAYVFPFIYLEDHFKSIYFAEPFLIVFLDYISSSQFSVCMVVVMMMMVKRMVMTQTF